MDNPDQMGLSPRTVLLRTLMLAARMAALQGIPGETFDGWLEEAREAFRAEHAKIATLADGT